MSYEEDMAFYSSIYTYSGGNLDALGDMSTKIYGMPMDGTRTPKLLALEHSSQVDLTRLRAFLGDAAGEVVPVFSFEDGTKLKLHALCTDLDCESVAALNKLNSLLQGTGLEKHSPTHDFDPRQTEAIMKAINLQVSRGVGQSSGASLPAR